MSLFIYVTIHLGRGSIKENLASVNEYVEFFYTFPNMDMITSSYNSRDCSAVLGVLTWVLSSSISTLDLAELSKYSNNKWQGPALLGRSEIFENYKNNTESGETFIQTKNTETITEAPLIAVPKGRRVERSNILQYDYVCSSTVILVYCRVYSVMYYTVPQYTVMLCSNLLCTEK